MLTDTWGGEVEIDILSKHFKKQVAVVDIQTNNIYVYGEDNPMYQERIYLLYDGIHYDALIMRRSDADEDSFPTNDNCNVHDVDIDNDSVIIRVFSASDSSIYNKSKVLAAELRERTQYVDVSGFTLRCLVCGQGLIGQKDATEVSILLK